MITVVWFKRDLRTVDHAALAAACRAGPVLPLYIAEPSLWQADDASAWQWGFVEESLTALGKALAELGLPLLRLRGEVVDVLARLHAMAPFHTLVAHEETGNAHTYVRDVAVGRWCRAQGVVWREWPQHGVVRRLRSRDDWHQHWQAFMHSSVVPAPAPGALQSRTLPWPPQPWPSGAALGLAALVAGASLPWWSLPDNTTLTRSSPSSVRFETLSIYRGS